jgi:hypothetical protein
VLVLVLVLGASEGGENEIQPRATKPKNEETLNERGTRVFPRDQDAPVMFRVSVCPFTTNPAPTS